MKNPLGAPGSTEHHQFVTHADERLRYYRVKRQQILEEILTFWDLYLCQKREFRKKGEEWRANMALPDAFANVEAKTANVVSIMLSADPVIQPEAVQDDQTDEAKSVERLLDYTYRKNQFPKFLTKLQRSRSVAGTAFFKQTWTERVHTVTLSRDPKATLAYQDRLDYIKSSDPMMAQMIPDWQTDLEAFEQWRRLFNLSDKSKGMKLGPPPADGEQKYVRYRGPLFSQLPLSSVYVDPLVDEMENQNFIVHRTVKPLSWLERNKDKFNGAAVDYAMQGWDGIVQEEEELELARKMNIVSDTSSASDPYYRQGVELREIWQPGGEVPYALVLNNKAVINKNLTEMPFIHGECAIGAARSLVVAGHFYGISDLRPSSDLFWEKRKLRNLRMDGVTLRVLPAFARLKEVGIPDMISSIAPGQMIPMSRPDGIRNLIQDNLPPEAYREPEGIDAEIGDAMGIYASTKGAPAYVGRVTGTEFQGRENRAQTRIKLDAIYLEEDLYPENRKACALYAQLGTDPLVLKIGGDPNPFIQIDRSVLIEAMEQNWRFRGPNKAINRDMTIQQFVMWVKTYGAVLQPQEMREAAKLHLDLMDIRGTSKVLSDQGNTATAASAQAAGQAANTGNEAATDAAQASQETAPQAVTPEVAQSIGG